MAVLEVRPTDRQTDMILSRDPITTLRLYIKFSENVILGRERSHEDCLAPMYDLSNCGFTSITDKTLKPEESFLNLYVNECLESESAISSTHRIRRIQDDK